MENHCSLTSFLFAPLLPLSSHQVWLQLELKRIPYTLEKINMRCYGPKVRQRGEREGHKKGKKKADDPLSSPPPASPPPTPPKSRPASYPPWNWTAAW